MRRQTIVTKVRAPQWVQGVDEPEAWAAEYRWLLEAAFAIFNRTSEWPPIEDVQRQVADVPERAIAVAQLVIDMPAALGARFSQTVQLTVRALAHVPDAAPLLNSLVRVMQEAASRYPGEGTEPPVIRGSEIKEKFELDKATYRKVSALVFSEGWFFNGGGGDAEGDWYRYIRAEILQIRDVTDIRSYLDAVARYRFGPPEVEISHEPAKPIGLLERPARWLSKREVTVFDLLLITVVGGIIVGLAIWLLTR